MPDLMLWAIGPLLIVTGVLLFKYRNQAFTVMYKANTLGRKDPEKAFGDGSFFILPAIMAPLMGVGFLFYAAAETFGWN